MRIEEVMTSPVVVVTPETPVKEVATLLVRNGFGVGPVTGPDGRLIGIITEADLIAVGTAADPRRHLRRDLPDDAPSPRTAADVMTTPVVAARVGTDTADVIKIMRSEHLTRIPVLDDDSRLVGLVSRSDLLKPLVRPDAAIEADVRQFLAYWYPAGVADIRVAAGEVAVASPIGPTRPLVDHLIRAIPGVISLSHTTIGAGPSSGPV
jgi:CBS domain-containing protein